MYTMSLKSTSVSPPTVVTNDLMYCLLCISRCGSMVQYWIRMLEIVGSILLNFICISVPERQLMDCQM